MSKEQGFFTIADPQTPHGIASKVIHDELLDAGVSEHRTKKLMEKISKDYSSEEIIRVADAILRFGLAPLLDAVHA